MCIVRRGEEKEKKLKLNKIKDNGGVPTYNKQIKYTAGAIWIISRKHIFFGQLTRTLVRPTVAPMPWPQPNPGLVQFLQHSRRNQAPHPWRW